MGPDCIYSVTYNTKELHPISHGQVCIISYIGSQIVLIRNFVYMDRKINALWMKFNRFVVPVSKMESIFFVNILYDVC